MNKWEKAVEQSLLDSEKSVIAELEKQYRQTLKEIGDRIKILQADEMTQSKIYQLEYQKNLQKQVQGILEKMHGDNYSTIQQYLHDSYQDGYTGTMYSLAGQGVPIIAPIDQDAAARAIMTNSKIQDGLYEALGVDSKKLRKSISADIARGLSSGLTYSEMARSISDHTKAPLSRAKVIVRTEGHRVQEAARDDARGAAKERGCEIVKQWDSTLDGNTRPDHQALDGQIRELDEPFEIHGMKAMYAGDFGDPAEDCNCRCRVNTRAKWALDASELAELKQRAEYFELDKSDDFKTFESKYLKATQK